MLNELHKTKAVKLRFNIFFLLSFLFAVNAFGQTPPVKPIVSARFDSVSIWTKNFDTVCWIYTTVTVRNNSADTITYYYSVCGEPYTTDNKEIVVNMRGCDSLGTATVIILPRQSITEEVDLHANKIPGRLISKKFKIGLIYLYAYYMAAPQGPLLIDLKKGLIEEQSTLTEKEKEAEKEAQDNPVWSNEIEIK